jgi:kynureninase
MKRLGSLLDERGATVDEREPDIVRVAPAPIYNSYRDVQRFVSLLAECLLVEE